MGLLGAYTKFPALVDALPPLVRKQRTLAGRIQKVAKDVVDEKDLRGQIDQLLVAAGLKKSDVITCNGYDVRHNEKAGQTSINQDVLTESLVAAGVDRELVKDLIVVATDTGDPSKFATVTPSKGAKVRA